MILVRVIKELTANQQVKESQTEQIRWDYSCYFSLNVSIMSIVFSLKRFNFKWSRIIACYKEKLAWTGLTGFEWRPST